MIRLLYFSTARPSVGRNEVNEIVAQSTNSNNTIGVTGALAFNGRNFCQVLEGEEDTLRALVERIRQDERHSGFKILDEKEIETRYFADWSMQLVNELDFSAVINSMHH